jgi:hypothetical protein
VAGGQFSETGTRCLGSLSSLLSIPAKSKMSGDLDSRYSFCLLYHEDGIPYQVVLCSVSVPAEEQDKHLGSHTSLSILQVCVTIHHQGVDLRGDRCVDCLSQRTWELRPSSVFSLVPPSSCRKSLCRVHGVSSLEVSHWHRL